MSVIFDITVILVIICNIVSFDRIVKIMSHQTLTTGEISKLCGVHFRTVIRWIEKGYLKAYKLPGRGDNRVAVPDFLDFLRKHDMPVPEELRGPSDRVLIVDDDRNMAKAMARILKRAGFEPQIATDGLRAGALLETYKPAVMTLDLNMPGLSGFDVLEFIRGSDSLSGIRILVVSALPQADLDKALTCGADAVLAKPFGNEHLVQSVRALQGSRPELATEQRTIVS